MGISTILLYGCEAVSITLASLRQLQVQQGKFIKSFLGLRKFSRTSPLQQALHIPSVSDAVGFSTLTLLKSILLHPSKASCFYFDLMSRNAGSCKLTSLFSRACSFAKNNHMSIAKYILNDAYAKSCTHMKYVYDNDGLVDSICAILDDYNCHGARELLQLLVNAF